MSLSDYHATATDWRLQLRKNQNRTNLVIAIFICTYIAVGFLADIVLVHMGHPKATITRCFEALIHLEVMPYATIVMALIALLSIWITFALHDRIMLLGTDSREITATTAKTVVEQQLYNVVEEMKVAAGLQYMPKVYLIEASYMNAFASGYSEKSAMVAITRGLIEKLDRAELQAVMAHELSHVRHLDIKLTLTVAVLSNLMLMVVDILFYSVMFGSNDNGDRRQDNRLFLVILLLRYTLPLFTIMLAMFLSRSRELMADAGSVELMRTNEPMARALLKIEQDHEAHSEKYAKEYGKTAHEQVRHEAYLFDPSGIDPVKSLSTLFSTHPSIASRLKALGFQSKK